MLRAGGILAVKGLGGYHLACDARNPAAVAALRDRKYRKEKPFALMVRDVEMARTLVELSSEAEALLTSVARPIVLAPARMELSGVAPENIELGVMLPYTPLHHLLFAAGAPEILVMTSANRSSEPIAYEDEDALQRLAGIADSFLIGQRPIARRVDDSVARAGAFGPVVLRRARGYAPGAVASLPAAGPVLALGADLKNTITLVVARPGLCEPAHWRLGSLPVAPRISARPSRTWSRCTKFAGTNCFWCTIFIRNISQRLTPQPSEFRKAARCSTTARTWHLCLRSGESGRNES